eukprot:scaffold26384_cov48-Phaeocystis_antarctica.AAC.3
MLAHQPATAAAPPLSLHSHARAAAAIASPTTSAIKPTGDALAGGASAGASGCAGTAKDGGERAAGAHDALWVNRGCGTGATYCAGVRRNCARTGAGRGRRTAKVQGSLTLSVGAAAATSTSAASLGGAKTVGSVTVGSVTVGSAPCCTKGATSTTAAA